MLVGVIGCFWNEGFFVVDGKGFRSYGVIEILFFVWLIVDIYIYICASIAW